MNGVNNDRRVSRFMSFLFKLSFINLKFGKRILKPSVMNQTYKKYWLEKYATAFSILISVALTIGGCFMQIPEKKK